ncbi:MAG: hypothetical protein R3F59_09665 [Myxococcota bacterium]
MLWWWTACAGAPEAPDPPVPAPRLQPAPAPGPDRPPPPLPPGASGDLATSGPLTCIVPGREGPQRLACPAQHTSVGLATAADGGVRVCTRDRCLDLDDGTWGPGAPFQRRVLPPHPLAARNAAGVTARHDGCAIVVGTRSLPLPGCTEPAALDVGPDGRVAAVIPDRGVVVWDVGEDTPRVVVPLTRRLWAARVRLLDDTLWAFVDGGVPDAWRVSLADDRVTPYALDSCSAEVALSPDGRWLATGHGDRTALLDARTGHPVAVVPGCGQHQWSDDGSVLLVSQGTSWRAFEAPSGRELRPDRQRLAVGTTGAPRCAAWSPDGRWIATGTTKELVIWDAAEQVPVFEGPGLASTPCQRWHTRAFSADGLGLVWDEVTLRWPAGVGPSAAEPVDDAPPGDPQSRGLWTTRGGQWLGAWESIDALYLCDPDCDAFPISEPAGMRDGCADDGRCWMIPTDPSEFLVALSGDGRRVALGGEAVRVWDVADGTERMRAPAPSGEFPAALSDDGETLAWVGDDGVWTWADGRVERLTDTRPSLLLVSRDGRRVVVGGPSEASVYDLDGRLAVAELDATPLALSPDGRRLLGVAEERTLIFDLP